MGVGAMTVWDRGNLLVLRECYFLCILSYFDWGTNFLSINFHSSIQLYWSSVALYPMKLIYFTKLLGHYKKICKSLLLQKKFFFSTFHFSNWNFQIRVLKNFVRQGKFKLVQFFRHIRALRTIPLIQTHVITIGIVLTLKFWNLLSTIFVKSWFCWVVSEILRDDRIWLLTIL